MKRGLLCAYLPTLTIALFAFAESATAEDAASPPRLIQQTADCSDVDFIPAGWTKPAFRLLLPEHIAADEQRPLQFVHTKRGQWTTSPDELHGVFTAAGIYEITTDVKAHDTYVDVTLAFRNLTKQPLKNVRVLICSAANHQPGTPPWANRLFIPADMKDDRDLQGRYWYQHVTPKRLHALRPQGWVATHPSPENSDPDRVPKYSFLPSETTDTIAYAAESADGKWLFYQAWDKPSRYETPCPGNACMHLQPLVSSDLAPEATATVRGQAGLFSGTRDQLREMLRTKGFGQ